MTYTPIYITKEGIGLKLTGRLNIQPNQFQLAPYQTSVPSFTVNDDLVDQVIEQKEEFLNLILNQIYELPLSNNHFILTDIVESLVISELLRIHFIGQGITQLGNDLSGTGTDTKQYAYGLIQMLTAGLNIYLPGVPPIQSIPGTTQPQPLKLPGERTRENYQSKDLITNDYTYVTKNPHARYKKDTLNFMTDDDRDFNFVNHNARNRYFFN